MVVHNIGDRNDDTGNAVRVFVAVHILGKADKADAHLHKQVINQTSRVAVIAGKTGKVFDDHAVNLAAHNIGKQPLEVFTVCVCPGMPIVYIFSRAFKLVNVHLVKIIEKIALVFHAVAVVFIVL